MTENLLQELEKKMMILLSEIEDLRKEVHRAQQENASLKSERENHSKKLQELLYVMDTISVPNEMQQAPKPMLVQG